MKRLTTVILMALAIVAFTTCAAARTAKDTRDASRERLAEHQALLIAQKLKLPAETALRFIDTYKKCQQEIWALGKGPKKTRRRAMTEQQTDSMLQARFDHRQKLLDISRKYHAEYSTFLTPKQIERVYKIERRMAARLHKRRR